MCHRNIYGTFYHLKTTFHASVTAPNRKAYKPLVKQAEGYQYQLVTDRSWSPN